STLISIAIWICPVGNRPRDGRCVPEWRPLACVPALGSTEIANKTLCQRASEKTAGCAPSLLLLLRWRLPMVFHVLSDLFRFRTPQQPVDHVQRAVNPC